MTPSEFVSHLAPVESARLALIFDFLAVKHHDFTLENGKPLSDGIDFSAFFQEVAVALKSPQPGMALEAPIEIRTHPRTVSRFSSTEFCPDCGHIHADDSECGFPQGGGRICRCERQVSA